MKRIFVKYYIKLNMKKTQIPPSPELKPTDINTMFLTQRGSMIKALASQDALLEELLGYQQALKILLEAELNQLNLLDSMNNKSTQKMVEAKIKYEEEERLFMQLQNAKANEQRNERNALMNAKQHTLALEGRQKMKRDEINLLERQLKEINEQDEILCKKIEMQQQENSKIEKKVRKMADQKRQVQKFIEETYLIKKKLNNQLQQLRGNIRVYCRIRPMLSDIEGESTYELVNENTLKLNVPKGNYKSDNHQASYSYNFQQIFNQKQTQQQIFEELAQLIQSAADGKKVCIFAYGQTGSGKTFTMQGGENEERGIIPRSIDLIFQEVQRAKQYSWQYSVAVSIQEVYLDTVRDLLLGTVEETQNKTIKVNDADDIHMLLDTAAKNRKVAETYCNEHSSRSHLIFTIHLCATNPEKSLVRKGSLNLVDLAGSERVGESGVFGERMKETQAINKSLTQLGVVISAMGKKQGHIPFRSSKLTHLLQKYLEGDSKTLMFVNISPKASDFGQTLCSLRFADKVKECKLKK